MLWSSDAQDGVRPGTSRHGSSVRVTFWGVRGSIPTPGSDTRRWGGNSSCLEVRHEGADPLVLDCGTGARGLGRKLLSEPGRSLDLLFTHLHMDHVFGLPFFLPIYTPGFDVRITVPAFSPTDARAKLARYLNGVYHPTRLRDLADGVTFHAIRSGRSLSKGPLQIEALSLNHPGGSLGYRVTGGGRAVAYITDTAPFARPGEGVEADQSPVAPEQRVIAFLAGCDLIIYDTMYSREEYLEKMTWGHSYPEYAAALCRAAGCERLVLFHHLPDDSDDELDRRAEQWSTHREPRVEIAREGQTLVV